MTNDEPAQQFSCPQAYEIVTRDRPGVEAFLAPGNISLAEPMARCTKTATSAAAVRSISITMPFS
jgi:hypothetical protein